MPGMDGFETARDIKRRKKTRDLPIIFLTAVNSDPDYAFRGYAAGAVDFISKPFDPWVLRAKVSVFVELHNKNKQLREQTALLREQAALLREQSTLLRDRPADGDPRRPAPGAAAERLAAVEEQAEIVGKRVPDSLRAEVEELERRIADLRRALDGEAPGAWGRRGDPRNAAPGGTAPRRVRPRSPSRAARRAERESRPGAMLPRRRPMPPPQGTRADRAVFTAMTASASGG